MKLTCPDCTTQFQINPEAIGANGRTVRCSHCSGTWFVAADPDVLDLREQIEEVQAQSEVSYGRVDQFGRSKPTGWEGTSKDVAPDATPLESSVFENSVLENAGPGEVDRPLTSALAPHVVMRDRADKKKVRRRLMGVGMIWGVVLAILGIATLAAYALRVPLTERFPVALKMYEAVGIVVPVAGLEIYDRNSTFGTENGQSVLSVTGKVRNVDVKSRDVPLIKLSFKDETGKVLASWVIEPDVSVLKPEAHFSFATQYPNPPEGAVNLSTSFVDETEETVLETEDEMPVVTD